MKDHQHIVCLQPTKNTGWQILEMYKCKKILLLYISFTNEIKRSVGLQSGRSCIRYIFTSTRHYYNMQVNAKSRETTLHHPYQLRQDELFCRAMSRGILFKCLSLAGTLLKRFTRTVQWTLSLEQHCHHPKHKKNKQTKTGIISHVLTWLSAGALSMIRYECELNFLCLTVKISIRCGITNHRSL